MPNILGHKTQEEADVALHTFTPLVNVDCSPHLKTLLCSVYTPECVSGKALPPCRTLCEKARSSCEGLLKIIGQDWPKALRCETFTTESCAHVSLPCFNTIHVKADQAVLICSIKWKVDTSCDTYAGLCVNYTRKTKHIDSLLRHNPG